MLPIKVVIADDHALFRDGLRKILSLEKDILVVGEAANGDEIPKIIERTKPDILLLDVKMPKGDVVQSLLDAAARNPATRVIILTAFSEDENVLNAAKGGAKGYAGSIRKFPLGKSLKKLFKLKPIPVKRHPR